MNTIASFQSLKLQILLFIFISLIFLGYILRTITPINFEFVIGILFFISLYVSWKNRFKHIDKSILIWIGVVFVYWLTSLIASIYHGPLGDRGWSVMNVVHAVFPFLFLLLTLYFLKPSSDFFWGLIGLATLTTVSLFSFELYALGLDKLENFTNVVELRLGESYSHPVKLGVIANTFFIIMLGSLPWAYRKGRSFFIFWVSLLTLNLLGVILTQTRTAWLGWPEALIGWGIYYWYYYNQFYRITTFSKWVFVALFTLALVAVLLLPVKSIFIERFSSIKSDIQQYTLGEKFETNLGARFLSYEVALVGIRDSKWFGIGEDTFESFQKDISRELAKEKFNQEFSGFEYTHIHNQFLMSWLTKGFFAFLSVVLIFVFLIWHFTRGLKNATFENKPIWIAGLVFSVASLLSFMPETPLQKSDTSTHFFLLATLLVAFSILTEERQNKMLIEESGKQYG